MRGPCWPASIPLRRRGAQIPLDADATAARSRRRRGMDMTLEQYLRAEWHAGARRLVGEVRVDEAGNVLLELQRIHRETDPVCILIEGDEARLLKPEP